MQKESSQDPKGQETTTLSSNSFDDNVRELESLANFYHRHGFPKEAQEIRQAIVNLRLQALQRTSGIHKIAQVSEPDSKANSSDI